MSAIRAFLALPGGERRLLLRALATVVEVRLALRLVGSERLRGWAARIGHAGDPAEEIAWAVRTVSQHLPGTTCLASALALQRLLSRGGHVSELHIGVMHNPGGLSAHAWLVCNGEVLVGAEGQDDFTPLLVWRSGKPG
jgi:hypothetical protein